MGKAFVPGLSGGGGIAWTAVCEAHVEKEVASATTSALELWSFSLPEGDDAWDVLIVDIFGDAGVVKIGGGASSSDYGRLSLTLYGGGVGIGTLASSESTTKNEWRYQSVKKRVSTYVFSGVDSGLFGIMRASGSSMTFTPSDLAVRVTTNTYGEGTVNLTIRVWGGKFQLPE